MFVVVVVVSIVNNMFILLFYLLLLLLLKAYNYDMNHKIISILLLFAVVEVAAFVYVFVKNWSFEIHSCCMATETTTTTLKYLNNGYKINLIII